MTDKLLNIDPPTSADTIAADDEFTTIRVTRRMRNALDELAAGIDGSKRDAVESLYTLYERSQYDNPTTTGNQGHTPLTEASTQAFAIHCPVCGTELSDIALSDGVSILQEQLFAEAEFKCATCNDSPPIIRKANELVAVSGSHEFDPTATRDVMTEYWSRCLRNRPSTVIDENIYSWVKIAEKAGWAWSPPLDALIDRSLSDNVFDYVTSALNGIDAVSSVAVARSDGTCCERTDWHIHLTETQADDALDSVEAWCSRWVQSTPIRCVRFIETQPDETQTEVIELRGAEDFLDEHDIPAEATV